MASNDAASPLHLRFFVSSPGDVADERRIVLALIEELARKHAFRSKLTTQVVAWDDAFASTPMDATTTPQDMVNRYCGRPADCDLTIVLLWSRLGTPLTNAFCKPDGTPYESGTMWELDDAQQAGKQVWLYRRDEEPVVPLLDPDYAKKVDAFKAVSRFFERFVDPNGALPRGYCKYRDAEKLRELVSQHLEAFARERLDVQLARFVAAEKGVPVSPLRAILTRLGDNDVPDEQIPERLARAADEIIELRKRWQPQSKTEPTSLRTRTLTLVEKGEFDQALHTLQEARSEARRQRETAACAEAEWLADEARVTRLQMRYRESSELYAQAAELVRFDPAACAKYLGQQARVLRSRGEESADNAAFHQAIAIYQQQIACFPQDSKALDWATAHNDLGLTLWRLGERESGTENLNASVRAFEHALTVRTRKQAALDWAETQNNLGLVLATLGEREREATKLLAAIATYRCALEEYTRDRTPLDWAMVQNNLGNALWRLGEREPGSARLLEAIDAFRSALQVYTRTQTALDWAMTQNNLGNALATLAEHESGTGHLIEAVDAFTAALSERTRVRVPPDWAITQNNLGCTLTSLGEREASSARLKEAVEAHRAALEVNTREQLPLDWAMTQSNLGLALTALGKAESSRATLLEAVQAYRGALEIYTLDSDPRDWAETQSNLGSALEALWAHECEAGRLLEALDAYCAALQVHTRSDSPLEWAAIQSQLGRVQAALARRDDDPARKAAALEALHGALEVYRATLGDADEHTEATLHHLRELGDVGPPEQ